MQCYEYQVLCRALVYCVKERYPQIAFDICDAADAIDDYGIESVTQYPDIVSIARNIGMGIRLVA